MLHIRAAVSYRGLTMNASEHRLQTLRNNLETFKQQPCVVSPDKWDHTFMQLRGIKGFWEEYNWDEILLMCPELEWIKEVRADETFKQVYKVLVEIEQLERLL